MALQAWVNQDLGGGSMHPSYGHNLAEFERYNSLPVSDNTFNDHSLLNRFEVIKEGWEVPQPKEAITLSPLRKINSKEDHGRLVAYLFQIFTICSYDPANPILMDRHGRILDGHQRLRVCSFLNKPVYVKRLNYE